MMISIYHCHVHSSFIIIIESIDMGIPEHKNLCYLFIIRMQPLLVMMLQKTYRGANKCEFLEIDTRLDRRRRRRRLDLHRGEK